MKVKIIRDNQCCYSPLETRVNDFIKDKEDVVSIKLDLLGEDLVCMILYKE